MVFSFFSAYVAGFYSGMLQPLHQYRNLLNREILIGAELTRLCHFGLWQTDTTTNENHCVLFFNILKDKREFV